MDTIYDIVLALCAIASFVAFLMAARAHSLATKAIKLLDPIVSPCPWPTVDGNAVDREKENKALSEKLENKDPNSLQQRLARNDDTMQIGESRCTVPSFKAVPKTK